MAHQVDRSKYQPIKSSSSLMFESAEDRPPTKDYSPLRHSHTRALSEENTAANPIPQMVKRSGPSSDEGTDDESFSVLSWLDRLVLTPEYHDWFFEFWTAANVIGLLLTGYIEPFAMTRHNSLFDVVATTCIDMFFTVDTILQFFMAYPYFPPHSSVVIWECSFRKIATNYASLPCFYKFKTGWFWTDLLTLLPGWLYHFGLLHQNDATLTIVIRSFRFIRFRRAHLFSICLDQCHELHHFRYSQLQCLKFVLVFTLTSHVLACLWLKAALHKGGYNNSGQTSWLTEHIATRDEDPCADEHRLFGSEHLCYYSIALYWSIQTLTSVGYGDMVPQNQKEYILNLVCMVMASAVWTFLLADMVALLDIVNANYKEHRLRTDRLHDFTKRWQLSNGLRSSLFRYNRESRKASRLAQEHMAIRKEISTGLERRIVSGTPTAKILQSKVWWIGDTAWDCAMDIVAAMQPIFYGPKEIVPLTYRMVLIQKGEMVFKMKFLGPGDIVGEKDILFSVRHLMANCSPYTLLYTDALVLYQKDLMSIFQQYPMAYSSFRHAQVRTIAWRGFVHAAKHDMQRRKLTEEASAGFQCLDPEDTVMAAIGSLGQKLSGLESSVGERLSGLEEKMGLMMDMITAQSLGKKTGKLSR